MEGLSRRNFLRMVGAGTCGAAIHRVLSPVGSMLAYAAPPSAMAFSSNPVFVLVNLSGGCSYNIAPIYHGAYRDLNPTVSYGPENSLAINGSQGLHPALTGLKAVYDEGHTALINMVGYPNPNRSHAESTEIWFTGSNNGGAANGGWASRLTCAIGSSFFNGVSLSGNNTLTQGDCNPPHAFGDLDNFGEHYFWGGSDGTEHLRSVRNSMIYAANAPLNANHSHVNNSVVNLQTSLQTMQNATRNLTLPVAFPNTGLGNIFSDAAKLIAVPSLGVRFIFIQAGGYDTHSDERASLNNNLTQLNGGLTAFINCAKALGRWNDVVLSTMTEFCRTFENGSQGTDHGHAGPMIIAGGSVIGGVKNAEPSVAETNASNDYYHQHHVDFRAPFSQIVSAMGYDSSKVFTSPFDNSNLALF